MRWSFKLLFSLFIPLTAQAGESHSQFHLESFAQYRDLNQEGYAEEDSQFEGFLLTDFNWSWNGDWLFFEGQPQIRILQSPGVETPGPQFASIEPSHRWLNTTRRISQEHDHEAYFDFDRLNLRLHFAESEFYVGRRPISLGVLRLFPVWNKLTLPLVFQPGPEWIDNPDGGGLSTQLGEFNFRLLALRGTNPHLDSINMLEVKYSPGPFEIQALAADWWRREAYGLAFSADFLEATWRWEGLAFNEDRDHTEPALNQWGAGVERALDSRWTAAVEYFQQSLCQTIDTGYTLLPPSRLEILSGCRYIFPYVDFQLNAEWKFDGGILWNMGDRNAVGIFHIDYSWSDSLNLLFKAKWAYGEEGGEFGPERIVDPFGRSLGAQSTLYFGLSYTI